MRLRLLLAAGGGAQGLQGCRSAQGIVGARVEGAEAQEAVLDHRQLGLGVQRKRLMACKLAGCGAIARPHSTAWGSAGRHTQAEARSRIHAYIRRQAAACRPLSPQAVTGAAAGASFPAIVCCN